MLLFIGRAEADLFLAEYPHIKDRRARDVCQKVRNEIERRKSKLRR